MQKIKTVFFGTHEFAAEILKGLLDSGLFLIDLVITQPDRKIGRKQTLEESAVKKISISKGIKVEQPESLKDFQHCHPERNARLPSPSAQADGGQEGSLSNFQLAIVAQYGLIITKNIIDLFPMGMINVHGSLLPKYRGASPIQTTLVNGDKKTGITIMLMDEKMDHGPILAQKTIKIEPDDTYSTLSQKMAEIGLQTLLNAIPDYTNGKITPKEQEGKATYAKLLTREDGKLDFRKSAEEIYNQFRGLSPWPGIWTVWNNDRRQTPLCSPLERGKRLKFLKIKKAGRILKPGQAQVEKNKIFIGCGEGSIEVQGLQLEGKNPMDSKTFLNGYKNIDGDTL